MTESLTLVIISIEIIRQLHKTNIDVNAIDGIDLFQCSTMLEVVYLL